MSLAAERVLYAPDLDLEKEFLQALATRNARKEAEVEERRAATGQAPGRTKLYVSEVGSVVGDTACWRKLWYAWHNAPRDPFTAQTLVGFEIGGAVEYRFIQIMQEQGYLTDKGFLEGMVDKVQFRPDFDPFPVSGKIDVMFHPEKKKIAEVKSCTQYQWTHLPKQDHIDQLMLYLWGLRHEPMFRSWEGSLVYFSKDSRKGQDVLCSFKIPYDEAHALQILGEYTKAYHMASNGTLPGKPAGFKRGNWPCGYCSFNTHCWEGKDR